MDMTYFMKMCMDFKFSLKKKVLIEIFKRKAFIDNRGGLDWQSLQLALIDIFSQIILEKSKSLTLEMQKLIVELE